MSKLKYKVEFPCGYKIECETISTFFGSIYGEFNEEDFKECPLHGKKCPLHGKKYPPNK